MVRLGFFEMLNPEVRTNAAELDFGESASEVGFSFAFDDSAPNVVSDITEAWRFMLLGGPLVRPGFLEMLNPEVRTNAAEPMEPFERSSEALRAVLGATTD